MKYFKLLSFICLVGILASCKKDEETKELDLGYDYFVENIGSYVIYQVDSTIYNDFDATIRNVSVQFKEKIVENFKDNLDREAHRVERYVRANADEDWRLARTYYFVKQERALEKVEENLRFVSFVFPPKENLEWEGNRFIETVDNNKYLADWKYKLTTVNAPATVNGVNYAHTATVLLRDRETQIEKIFAKEIYARGVGMIYKEWWHLETQTNFEKPWLEKAEKGYVIKMQAITHGVE